METVGDLDPLTVALFRPLEVNREVDPAGLRDAIARGADVNARNHENDTALRLACYRGHLEAVKILVDAGADLNADLGGFTPMLTAIMGGFVDVVKFLNKKGVAIGGGVAHVDALSYAVISGSLPMVKLVLKHGASIVVDDGKLPPLLPAVQYNRPEVFKYLLAHGADINQSFQGNTAVATAAVFGNVPMLKTLVAKGAKLDTVNDDGQSPVEFALKFGQVEAARALIEAGAEGEIPDGAAAAAPANVDLTVSQMWGQYNAELLTPSGEAMTTQDTALTNAIATNDVPELKRLLKDGADVNRMLDGLSLLTTACRAGAASVARHLISAGAAVKQAEKEKISPLYFALRSASKPGMAEVIDLLLSKGAPINDEDRVSLFWAACAGGDLRYVRKMLDGGSDPRHGIFDPLFTAAEAGHLDIVKYLLQNHELREVFTVNHEAGEFIGKPLQGATALYAAAKSGHEDVILFLLDLGADPLLAPGSDLSPLIMCINSGLVKCVEKMLRSGAKLPKDSPHDMVTVAAQSGSVDMVKIVAKAGLKLDNASLTKMIIDALGTKAQVDPKRALGCDDVCAWAASHPKFAPSSKSADPDQITTLVKCASGAGSPRLLRALLDAGVDLLCDLGGFKAIHTAAASGNALAVRLLLDLGEDVNAAVEPAAGEQQAGMTPLHFAAMSQETISQLAVIEELLQRGANPAARSSMFKQTPLDYAASAVNVATGIWLANEWSSPRETVLASSSSSLPKPGRRASASAKAKRQRRGDGKQHGGKSTGRGASKSPTRKSSLGKPRRRRGVSPAAISSKDKSSGSTTLGASKPPAAAAAAAGDVGGAGGSASAPSFGSVLDVSGDRSLMRHLVHGGDHVMAVVELFPRHEKSELLRSQLAGLAKKFRHIQFVCYTAVLDESGAPTTVVPTITNWHLMNMLPAMTWFHGGNMLAAELAATAASAEVQCHLFNRADLAGHLPNPVYTERPSSVPRLPEPERVRLMTRALAWAAQPAAAGKGAGKLAFQLLATGADPALTEMHPESGKEVRLLQAVLWPKDGEVELLCLAVVCADVDFLKRVLDLCPSIDINGRDSHDKTALQYAQEMQGNPNATKVFDVLSQHGAHMFTGKKEAGGADKVKAIAVSQYGLTSQRGATVGESPLHQLVMSAPVTQDTMFDATTDLVAPLKEYINSTADAYGRTPLFHACLRNHVGMVKTLIDFGAKPTIVDAHGWTVMHEAANGGASHAIKHLLTLPSGQELRDKRNEDGHLPIHVIERAIKDARTTQFGLPAARDALLQAGSRTTTADYLLYRVPMLFKFFLFSLFMGVLQPGQILAGLLFTRTPVSAVLFRLGSNQVSRFANLAGFAMEIALLATPIIAISMAATLFLRAYVFAYVLFFVALIIYVVSRARHDPKFFRVQQPSSDLRLNLANVSVIASMLADVGSFVALPFMVNDLNWPEGNDVDRSPILLLDFSVVPELTVPAVGFRYSFIITATLVALWILITGYFSASLLILNSADRTVLRRQYPVVKTDFMDAFYLSSIVPQIVGPGFALVLSVLFSTLDCTLQPDGTATLDSSPDIICWQGEHAVFGIVAFLALMYFLPSSVLIGQYFLDNPSAKRSISFIGFYVFVRNLMKVFITGSATFFSNFPAFTLPLMFVALAALTVLAVRYKPCHFQSWVNMFQVATYVAAMWVVLCAFISFLNADPSDTLPFQVLSIGWALVGIVFLVLLCVPSVRGRFIDHNALAASGVGLAVAGAGTVATAGFAVAGAAAALAMDNV